MKNIIEFLNLTQTLLEIDQELKELHSFIKTFSKPKSYKKDKKDEDKKVIPITTEEYCYEDNDTKVIPSTIQPLQEFKISTEEYCYEDDDFTYTNDP